MSFIYELKRRNVFRVGAAYLIAAWLLIQVADTVFPYLGVPDAWTTALIIMLGVGFPLALLFAWIYELTPEGLRKDAEVAGANPLAPVTARRLNLGIIALLAVAVAYLLVDKFYLVPAAGMAAQPKLGGQAAGLAEAAPAGAAPASPGPGATAHGAGTSSVSPGAAGPDGTGAGAEVAGGTTPGTAAPGQSVAVLPFRAMSAGEEDGFFADGLTEEILNSLARLPGLLVTARTSSFYFKNKDLPVPEIAATLGVAHVVEGSVRRSGETVRITAQLIRAGDGFHLWSETYDRTLADVFAVQEDIAVAIANTLSVVLDERQRRELARTGTRDIDAFIAYQRAATAHSEAHVDLSQLMPRLDAAEPLFDAALALDPGLGQAWFLRSDRDAHALFNAAFLPETAVYPAGEMAQTQARMTRDLDRALETTEDPQQYRMVALDHALLSDSWRGLGAIAEATLDDDTCLTGNWTSALTPFYPRAANAFFERMVVCDPLNYTNWFQLMFTDIWSNGPERTRETVSRSLAVASERTAWSDFALLQAALAERDFEAARGVPDEFEDSGMVAVPFELRILAAEGRIAEGKALAAARFDVGTTGLEKRLTAAAILGQREEANRIAGLIDARPLGYFALLFNLLDCACGTLFDLEATPNFALRLRESGLPWPPVAPIEYPAKTW